MSGRIPIGDHSMKLATLATRDVLHVAPDDSLDKAIGLMEEHNIHHLPVVATGVVVGMVSDRDILLAVGWQLTADRRVEGARSAIIGPRRVSDVMSKPVVSLPPHISIPEAARLMIERRISAVVLVEHDRLAGIITRIDLLAKARELANSAERRAVLRHPIRQHMMAHVFTVAPRDAIQEAASLMHRKGVRHLPVVTNGELVGIISDRDLRRTFGLEMIEDERAQAVGHLYVPPSAVMDIMTRAVRTIAPEASLLDAADQMARHRIGALPVTREDKLVGIITDTDLVRILGQLAA